MILAALVNGEIRAPGAAALAIDDRGLQYGDGLFETTLVRNGNVRFWNEHLERLAGGCERLGMAAPDRHTLTAEVAKLTGRHPNAVLKIIVTRGAGGRGYRPDKNSVPTRIVTMHSLPADLDTVNLRARWCETRLGRNAALAGLKHLNRLEQVLARNEWDDEQIHEGLMLDTEGELISATSANVFLVREGALCTPDLRFCGIRGIMRGKVLQAALGLGLAINEEPLWPEDVEAASELFVTNAVRGIRVITQLGERVWHTAPMATQLRATLDSN